MPITVVAIFLLDFFNPFFFFFFLLHDKNHGLHEDSGSGIVNRGGVRGHRIDIKEWMWRVRNYAEFD